MKNKIRIANASGYWGDDLSVLRRQVLGGKVDYVTMDFLAEITMSVLKKQQMRNPALGYVNDFVGQIIEVAPILREKKIKVISNAGGMNPLACGNKITEELKKLNLHLSIAVIDGDDFFERIDDLYPDKALFRNLETGADFSTIKDQLLSANAYLGSLPILAALASGVDLVITGRATDTAITLAPMIHELGWKLADWDRLAAGVIAGHIIECGAQATGGNFTDWHKVPHWLDFGYPIIEMQSDGVFNVTKHPNTGGLVTVDTIKEQLLYEMGNPVQYISPDVVADFTSVHLEDIGPDGVRVSGIRGGPATQQLKVSMAYKDGFKSSGSLLISGPQALAKAEKFAEIFWQRLNLPFEKKNTEWVGYNSCHKNLAPLIEPNEILLRLSVYDHAFDKVQQFAKSISTMILSGPPGVAVTGGRAHIQEVISYWPALVPKAEIQARVTLLPATGKQKAKMVASVTGFEQETQFSPDSAPIQPEADRQKFPLAEDGLIYVDLSILCLARSGDKGDTCNIGVIARNEKIYHYLDQYLTASVIKEIFGPMVSGPVHRFDVPNLLAFNFLLEQALDGGGTRALNFDAQGKTIAQALLAQKIPIPLALWSELSSLNS